MTIDDFKFKELNKQNTIYQGQTLYGVPDGVGMELFRDRSNNLQVMYVGLMQNNFRHGFGKTIIGQTQYTISYMQYNKRYGFSVTIKENHLVGFFLLLSDKMFDNLLIDVKEQIKNNICKEFHYHQQQIEDYFESFKNIEITTFNSKQQLQRLIVKRQQLEYDIKMFEQRLWKIFQHKYDYFEINFVFEKIKLHEKKFPNELLYLGQQIGENQCGLGKLTIDSQTQYIGWYDNVINGFGTMYQFDERIKTCGFWKNNEQNGIYVKMDMNNNILGAGETTDYGRIVRNYCIMLKSDLVEKIKDLFLQFQNKIEIYLQRLPDAINKIDDVKSNYTTFKEFVDFMNQEQESLSIYSLNLKLQELFKQEYPGFFDCCCCLKDQRTKQIEIEKQKLQQLINENQLKMIQLKDIQSNQKKFKKNKFKI